MKISSTKNGEKLIKPKRCDDTKTARQRPKKSLSYADEMSAPSSRYSAVACDVSLTTCE